uniref:Uncharacterized protein n=1 Tax=Setaria viridis TaxID=4556 RepID=A0A4U6W5Q7_SETVI|nr:hypothetical protein SEVIR_1G080000v2 [Setaria viridis]
MGATPPRPSRRLIPTTHVVGTAPLTLAHRRSRGERKEEGRGERGRRRRKESGEGEEEKEERRRRPLVELELPDAVRRLPSTPPPLHPTLHPAVTVIVGGSRLPVPPAAAGRTIAPREPLRHAAIGGNTGTTRTCGHAAPRAHGLAPAGQCVQAHAWPRRACTRPHHRAPHHDVAPRRDVLGCPNHLTAEDAAAAPDVALGEFLVDSIKATVLFDTGAKFSYV